MRAHVCCGKRGGSVQTSCRTAIIYTPGLPSIQAPRRHALAEALNAVEGKKRIGKRLLDVLVREHIRLFKVASMHAHEGSGCYPVGSRTRSHLAKSYKIPNTAERFPDQRSS